MVATASSHAFAQLTQLCCRGDALYTQQQIDACLERVVAINIEEPFHLPGVTLTAYYAGHVIGAAMMHCTIGSASILYTGDYNMVSDRLLGAVKVPRLRPDVLVTESTYATTLRDPRRAREGKLLDIIHHTVRNGGKVLVPVFAVGSAQEMSILIDSFWQRMHLKVCSHLHTHLSYCRLLPFVTTMPFIQRVFHFVLQCAQS